MIESLLHVRLRWVSVAFAALCGCLYTSERLYVAYAMFGSAATDWTRWRQIDAQLCESVIALMDAKHQLIDSIVDSSAKSALAQLHNVDDGLDIMSLASEYSKIARHVV